MNNVENKRSLKANSMWPKTIKETHEKFPKDSGISYITMHLDEARFKEFTFKLTELFHEYSKFAEGESTKEYKAGFIVFPKN